MTLLAALMTGTAVYLGVGAATGRLARLRPGAVRRRSEVSIRQQWLTQAGVELTPRQFVVGSVLAGLVAFGTLSLLTGTPAVAVVPAVVVGLLPRTYFARRRAGRLREVQEAWPDGLRDLIAAISAGLSLNRALEGLAHSGPPALQRAFARYPSLARMLGVGPALELIKEELADPTSDRVIEVLILAHERGGHILGDILRQLADATIRDIRTLDEIATDSLEQRINARAVFALPWLVLAVLTMQPGHFQGFYRSPGGLLVVAIGGALSLLGTWIVSRLGRDRGEARVFGGAVTEGER